MAPSSVEPNTKISLSIWRKLFSCQKGAILKVASYLQTPPNDRSALVQMPMGTGKTGIMALCCTQFPRYKRSLVVAPAEYLTRQLEGAITKKFWSDARLKAPSHVKVKRFTPATLASDDLSSNTVLICTVQSLQQMHAAARDPKYADLKNAIDLVLFDEGHSEPALTWAKPSATCRRRPFYSLQHLTEMITESSESTKRLRTSSTTMRPSGRTSSGMSRLVPTRKTRPCGVSPILCLTYRIP